MKYLLWAFALIGLVAVLVLGSIATAGLTAIRQIKPLMEEAPVFADASLAAFGVEWSEDALLARAAPSLIDDIAANPAALSGLIANLKRLGQLDDAAPFDCERFFASYTRERGRVFQTDCVTDARLARASVRFVMGLEHAERRWAVRGFFAEAIDVDGRAEVAFGSTADVDLTMALERAAFSAGAPAKPTTPVVGVSLGGVHYEVVEEGGALGARIARR
ncbi:MAG: hypothetical protein ACFB00_13290 [Parvularculaceae bacterium]